MVMRDDWREAARAWYFALSYRVLATPAGRAFLRAARADDAPAVHGYATAEDLRALVAALHPSPDDVIVDLGCGIGEVAIALHQRTGCQVRGIDASRRAISDARRRAEAAGVAVAVQFEVGDLGDTAIRGSAAFALDSLMFVRRAPDLLASISRSLEPPGRIFATFIDHRGLDREAFARYIACCGLRLEQLDDVTVDLAARSRARAAAARRVFRARPQRPGRLGLLLVLAEEAAVGWLIGRRRLRRWRFTAVQAAPIPGDAARAPTSG
jgi:SAM-dependent methyltransferase